MPRTCTICAHDDVRDLDRELLGQGSLRDIAQRYVVSKDALHRHRHHCLAPRVADSLARAARIDADRLTAWLTGAIDGTATLIVRSRHEELRERQTDADPGELRAYRREQRELFGELRQQVETLAKVSGLLRPGAPTVVVDQRRQVAIVADRLRDELGVDRLGELVAKLEAGEIVEGEIVETCELTPAMPDAS